MTLPPARIVYGGPASGEPARDADTQRVLYARMLLAYPDAKYSKVGESDDGFAEAESAMQAAAWSADANGYDGVSSYSDPNYTCKASLWRFDTQALSTNVEGETATRITFRIPLFEITDATQWRICWINTNSAAPTDAWSWITSATATTGGAIGRYSLDVNAVLLRYFFVGISLTAYSANSGYFYMSDYNDVEEIQYTRLRFIFA